MPEQMTDGELRALAEETATAFLRRHMQERFRPGLADAIHRACLRAHAAGVMANHAMLTDARRAQQDAEDALAAAQARIAVLEVALRPFARAGCGPLSRDQMVGYYEWLEAEKALPPAPEPQP